MTNPTDPTQPSFPDDYPPHTYPTALPAPTPTRKRKGLRRFIWPAATAVAVIGWIATAAASGNTTPAAAGSALPAPTVTVTMHDLAAAPAAPTTVAKPTPTPKPKPVKATIPDGYTVAVGSDVPAGRYEAHSDSTDCYWEITKHGSPDNIIDNGGFTKGHITVTLKRGEDFDTSECGDWTQE